MKKVILTIAFLGFSLVPAAPARADIPTATKIMAGAIVFYAGCELMHYTMPALRQAAYQAYLFCHACVKYPWRPTAGIIVAGCLYHICDELAKQDGVILTSPSSPR